jgi:hypothetical protein
MPGGIARICNDAAGAKTRFDVVNSVQHHTSVAGPPVDNDAWRRGFLRHFGFDPRPDKRLASDVERVFSARNSRSDRGHHRPALLSFSAKQQAEKTKAEDSAVPSAARLRR